MIGNEKADHVGLLDAGVQLVDRKGERQKRKEGKQACAMGGEKADHVGML